MRLSLAGVVLGAASLIAVSLGVGGPAGGGPAVAAGPGSTTTTAGSAPQSARRDVKEAQADLAKLDSVVAELRAQDKTAASDLATLQRDAKNGTLDRDRTTALVAAGADEVSAAIANLFASHAEEYQALSAQAEAFHQQFVNALNAAAGAYAQSEATQAGSQAHGQKP